MFKKIVYSSLFLLTSFSLNAQNSETRTLPPFSSITIDSKAKINVQPGGPQSVTVESKELNEVQTTVENGTLHINGKSSKLDITISSLNAIEIQGMGEVNVDSTFKNQTLTLRISGNGKINMPVDADNVKVEINGYGKLNLEGTANDLELEVSGNGKVNAEDLHVKNVKADISGMGKCLIDVTENLEVNISGMGSVYYKTEPAHMIKQVSGVGKLGNIDTENNDTTTVHLGKKRIVIIGGEEKEDHDRDFDGDFDNEHHGQKDKKVRSHWMGIDLGFNNYFSGTEFNTGLPAKYDFLELNTGKSVGVNLNFYAHDFKIYKRYVMFATGIGMSINNYRFNSDHTLIPEIDSVAGSPDSTTISLNKNKLAITYATVPLLLQFNSSLNYKKSFHVGTGVLLSYRIESHTKQVYTLDGDKQKNKVHDDFNLNPFRAEATLRIGYRGYTLFGNYALTELFNSGDGPELHPFTIGISLSNW